MRIAIPVWLARSLIFCAAFALPAQTSAPLLRLYATVFDTSGQAITDLSAKDFHIVDNGNAETPVFLRKPADHKNGRTGNTITILFDLMNQDPEDRLETWHRLDKSLPQLESGENVYFYMLNLEGELVPIHGMGPRSAEDSAWPHGVAPVLDQIMKTASHGKHGELGPEDRVKKTYHQLEVLATLLAGYPGHRNILWFTGRVPSINNPKVPCTSDWVDCGLYVPHLAVTLAQSNVAVNLLSYNVDLQAAVYADPGSWEDKWTPPPFADTHGAEMADIGKNLALSAQGGGSPTKGQSSTTSSRGRDATLNLAQMALLTGGGIYFRQDVRAVMQRVLDRDAHAFEILYDPALANWDNKFHRIRITCDRKGVMVQSRARYFAIPDSRAPAERMKAALLMAFQSPADQSDISLGVTVSPSPGSAHSVHLDIRVPVSDLLLREENGKFSGAVYLLISDRGASGPLGEPELLNLNPVLTVEQHDKALKDGLALGQEHPIQHPIQEGAREVRVIVLDQNTNTVGSVTVPVK